MYYFTLQYIICSHEHTCINIDIMLLTRDNIRSLRVGLQIAGSEHVLLT